MKLLDEIRLTNLLSYGPEGVRLELEPLNVLIGPNASGKSNLIAALALLAAAPVDLSRFFLAEGGHREWIWKGPGAKSSAEVEVALSGANLSYELRFEVVDSRLRVQRESLHTKFAQSDQDAYSYYSFEGSKGTLKVLPSSRRKNDREERLVLGSDLNPGQSILSQIKDPQFYPEMTSIGRQFAQMRFFRDWNLGRNSPLRKPQPADLPSDFLLEDGSNLGLVLNQIETHYPDIKKTILERLNLLYARIQDFTINVQGGAVQIFFQETGLTRPVPASRLSDGTLRFLGLLAILCHPSPPPLVCIEEPELGLHPDVVSDLADLFLEASRMTQLVVTTHSDALVSALSETPESIVVCEQEEEKTTLRRMQPADLAEWLEEYRLGDLWRMGQIGGNRW